jgi:hypothetical protein
MLGAEDVTQWYCACLACTRCWVQSLAPQKQQTTNKRREMLDDCLQWRTLVLSAIWKTEAVGKLEPRSLWPAWVTWEGPVSIKK